MNHLSTVTESQSLRKQICLKTPQSLLDQWGKIELLPEIGGALTQQVSSYFEVDLPLIRKVVQRHRRELKEFGYKLLKKKDFEKCQHVTFQIPNRGLAIFPPPAIFCVGLLLRDSIVAKNLRSCIWEYLQNRGINLIDEEVLMESRSLRDELCLDQNLGCLDRVETLATIDDRAWSTVEQVADFYRVDVEVIQKVIQRNRNELKGEGYKILRKKDLENGQFVHLTETTIPHRGIAIFPRRAILRVGMLLRDSEIAKGVRSYLLNAESQAPWRKKKALVPSTVAPSSPHGVSREEIIEIFNTGQERIREEMRQERQERKASLKDLEQTIRKLIWNLQEKHEKELDFLKRDSRGISQSCQSFYLGILGDFEDLKGQKGWENKEDLLSRLTDTIWKRILADTEQKHRQSMGRMNYFCQEMEKKFDQFELRITLFIQEFNEKIKSLEDRLDQLEIRIARLEGYSPTRNSTSSEAWKEKVREIIFKMAENLKNLGALL